MPIPPSMFSCMPTAAPAPGIYPGVAEPEYRRWAAWSQSILKGMGKWSNDAQAFLPAPERTPAHVYADLQEPAESTEAQKFGTDYHRLVMEPARFKREYVVVKHEINRRTNDGKAEWAALHSLYGESNVLDRDRWNELQSMARSLAKFDLARSALGAVGEHEVSGVFVDPETSETVKFRLDKLVRHGERHRIVDLKTTVCAHWDKFMWDAEKYGYHTQAATYVDGYALAADVDPGLIDYYIIAQEKKPPYVPIVFKVPDAWIDAGRVEYRAALKCAKRCIETGNWPGYADNRVVDLHLPDRAMAELEPIES